MDGSSINSIIKIMKDLKMTQMQQFMATDTTPEDTKITMFHKAQQEDANTINTASRPVIVITETSAESYGQLSYHLAKTMPHVPVIFENQMARKLFFNANYCERREFKNRCVGHFVKAADDYSLPVDAMMCKELNSSDCIIVFGKPQSDLSDELKKYGHVISNPNLCLVKPKQDIQDSWGRWVKQLRSPRGL